MVSSSTASDMTMIGGRLVPKIKNETKPNDIATTASAQPKTSLVPGAELATPAAASEKKMSKDIGTGNSRTARKKAQKKKSKADSGKKTDGQSLKEKLAKIDALDWA